ncbi:putative short-chain dehydrogenase/reductase family protein [Xylariomycetidae sp. FL0641]|nr:putative short-chain dehydrogenase/reductase family protein [Xylariomycetidae sp. FL0641]
MATRSNPSNISPDKEGSQIDFLRRQLFVTPPAVNPADVDLKGKTVIITGGNSGLGFHSAAELLGLGVGKLIITARNEEKGKAAEAALAAKKSSHSSVEVWPLDLSDYDSITAFVDRVKTLARLDAIVLNAASLATALRLHPQTKHEEDFQINYLSNALLCILLLPVLSEKKKKKNPDAPTRVVWVNSETAAWARFPERSAPCLFAALDREPPAGFDFTERYYATKLLCQLFLAELAGRVPPSVAVVAAVNPGFCWGSGLHSETSGIAGGVLAAAKRVLGRSSPVGARTLTDAAVKHGREVHGQYLGDCRLKPMAPLIYQPEGAKLSAKLWEETMAELAPFKVSEIIASMSD